MPYLDVKVVRDQPVGRAIRKPSSSSYSSYPAGSSGGEASGDAVSSLGEGVGDPVGALCCETTPVGVGLAPPALSSSSPPPTCVTTRVTATPTAATPASTDQTSRRFVRVGGTVTAV